ncbi:MAG TPA: universal stress protein [Vicinamibacterales bacterium]|jgi:nucleotide-binding universal stress UspA family protein
MNVRPSILCPIDFSEASAGAMRYAAAIAARFSTRLIVMTVEDPLLTEAVDLGTGIVWTPEDCKRDVEQFVVKTFGADSPFVSTMEFEVAVGKPATEVLRVARERTCELIVMSTHGLTGMRKLFFGSTTERVLRETTKPVLVTPPLDPGPIRVEDAKRLIHRILVAVDLSPASLAQTQAARRVADALELPMLLVNVVEPLKSRIAARLQLAGVEADRRAVAEEGLGELLATLPMRLHPEALVAYGDPAEEIAKVARDRQTGLVIVGLHGSPLLGPRMGSVTYRLLCVSSTLVLALPPAPVESRPLEVSREKAVSPYAGF